MTKDDLKRYRQVLREIQSLVDTINVMRAQLESTAAKPITGMPRGTAPGDPIADGVGEIDEIYAEYNRKLVELRQELAVTVRAIESVEDFTEKQVLRMRYIEGLSWEEICVSIGYSWRQTHRVHSSALKNIAGFERWHRMA